MILPTVRNGQAGRELQSSLMHLEIVIACDRNEMNLSNPESLRKNTRNETKTCINEALVSQ